MNGSLMPDTTRNGKAKELQGIVRGSGLPPGDLIARAVAGRTWRRDSGCAPGGGVRIRPSSGGQGGQAIHHPAGDCREPSSHPDLIQ